MQEKLKLKFWKSLFQKKVVNCISANKDKEYKSQLRFLNLIPTPRFIQLNDLLLVFKVLTDESSGIEIPVVHTKRTRNNKTFKMMETRKEKARSKFTFVNCRIKLSSCKPERNFNKFKKSSWTEKENNTHSVDFC